MLLVLSLTIVFFWFWQWFTCSFELEISLIFFFFQHPFFLWLSTFWMFFSLSLKIPSTPFEKLLSNLSAPLFLHTPAFISFLKAWIVRGRKTKKNLSTTPLLSSPFTPSVTFYVNLTQLFFVNDLYQRLSFSPTVFSNASLPSQNHLRVVRKDNRARKRRLCTYKFMASGKTLQL